MPGVAFEIRETQAGEFLRISPTGDLDMLTTPRLEDRLARLRAVKHPVSLDLSRVGFIDSTGLHLLIRTVGDARIKGWRFQIEPTVSPEVMRLLRLVHVDRFVIGNDARSPADSTT